MFGKNLKYYRLKNQMTMKELGEKIGASSMSISHYESGKRNPDMITLKKLANALNVRVMDFMNIRNSNLQFVHGSFRKQVSLTNAKKELIYESIEEYFNRFFWVVNLLGSLVVLPRAPKIHSLKLVDDLEMSARNLREWLNLSVEGPISNLINIIENEGIFVYLVAFDDHKFSGINGIVNGYPYIVINKNMTPERQRFTIAHELVHLAFDWNNDNTDGSKMEKVTDGIAGAFLFPSKDAIRELGIHRSGIQADMQIAAKEFGISMMCLAYRAKELRIISQNAYKSFIIEAAKCGWRKREPSRIELESSNLFKQLVYRAIEEEEINVQRGAELLQVTYQQVYEDLNQFFVRSNECI